jgi:hypothetical protein
MTDPAPNDTPQIIIDDFIDDPAEVAAMADRLARAVQVRHAHQPLPVVPDEATEIFGQFSSGKSRPLSMLLTELALTGRTMVVLDAKNGDTNAVWPTSANVEQATQRADPALVAAAMAGYRAEDLTMGETAAVERGIALATYRRLYPAVTGPLADSLAVRITYLAAHLAVETADERVYDVLLQDPRTPGFRLAVHEAQVAATKETVRRLAMRIEWALNAIALGREATAVAKLDEADAILT